MRSVHVRESNISGYGTFAKNRIKKGQRIGYIKGERRFKINRGIEDTLANPDWVGLRTNWWIDPFPPFKFLNHSCNPKAGIKGTVTLCALQAIEAGEEITIDYSTIEADEFWEMGGGANCLCREVCCRGIIRSIIHLPSERFNAYHPFIPTFFQKLYRESKKIE